MITGSLGESQQHHDQDHGDHRDNDRAHDPHHRIARLLRCELVENALAWMVAVALTRAIVGVHVDSRMPERDVSWQNNGARYWD